MHPDFKNWFHKRYHRSENTSVVRGNIKVDLKRIIPYSSTQYTFELTLDGHFIVDIIPKDFYSALLLEGLYIPETRTNRSLKIVDGNYLLEWDEELAKKFSSFSIRTGVHKDAYYVQEKDRIKFPKSKVKMDFENKLSSLLNGVI